MEVEIKKRTNLEGQKQLFSSGKTKDISFRKKALCELLKGIEKYEEELLESVYQDFHKNKIESYLTEIYIVKKEIRYFLKHMKSLSRKKKVRTSLENFPSNGYIFPEPYGVVFIISPWNYPINLSLCPLVGAIASGNCVLLRMSGQVKKTNQVIKKILDEIEEKEYIHILEGPEEEVENVIEDGVDYVFFTGSPRVGKIIMNSAAKTLTPVTLELGGKSPVILEESCHLRVAAKRIVWGKYINAGQTCVAPDYVLVTSKQKEMFIQYLKDEIQMFYENGKISSQYASIIHNKAYQRLESLLETGNIIIGGKKDKNKKIIEPTVIEIDNVETLLGQEEIFGPILVILEVTSVEEAIQIINQGQKPLALYIFSENTNKIQQILEQTSSGGVAINDTIMHITEENLPFGGVGNSGMGAYHAKASFDTFTHYKSVLKKSTKLDIPFRYPPYSDKIRKWLK